MNRLLPPHPIYPNADAREADRLREERLAKAAAERIRKLEAALKPFAELARQWAVTDLARVGKKIKNAEIDPNDVIRAATILKRA